MAHGPWQGAADRHVPHQPLALAGDLFNPASECQLNVRRIHELVRHLIRSGQIDAVVRELTSPAYIAAKFALGEGAPLMREYAEAEVAFKKAEAAEAAEAAADLAKCKATVGRFLKHLEQQPALFVLQMCFQEPAQHPLCVAAGRFLQELQESQESQESQRQGIVPRVLDWINKPKELDPCQLEIKEHAGTVNTVCYFQGAGEAGDCIASASDDGTVKITSDVSGEVLRELQAHEGKAVKSLAVSTDGTRMASGGADNKVRVWDTATGKCEQILEGHSGEVLGVAFPKEDCDLVASCSTDKTVRVWRVSTGECLATCSGHRCGDLLHKCALLVSMLVLSLWLALGKAWLGVSGRWDARVVGWRGVSLLRSDLGTRDSCAAYPCAGQPAL